MVLSQLFGKIRQVGQYELWRIVARVASGYKYTGEGGAALEEICLLLKKGGAQILLIEVEICRNPYPVVLPDIFLRYG